MTTACFVDSWAFVALSSGRDQWHEAADAANRALHSAGGALVTTNVVVYEALTTLRNEAGHAAAVEFGRWVEASSQTGGVDVVWITPALHAAGWDIFERYDDKDFSFVDCLSFAVMRERGIQVAFTGDRHFRQMGFITVPELETEQAP